MGISFSCPFAIHNDLENGFESVLVKSINLGDDEAKTPVRSISFKGHGFEPTIMKRTSSGQMAVEGSVSFKERESDLVNTYKLLSSEEKTLLTKSTDCLKNEMDNQFTRSESATEKILQLPVEDSGSPKHEAATKLQKVYKSFRTRRKLADCAVLIEQSWWKLLDFAELKHSSISFFELEKHETAISRWSRARTRAAKVGKGLSKNNKARKLALQHWLEAIDPRHRYGHNLHFYYVRWLQSQSKEPFFYWLDIGEGRDVNLVDKCPRSKLHLQCIKYLGPMERRAYEVAVEDGKLFYKETGELINTAGEPKGAKWIFVLSTSRTLYIGRKKKGTFQHSSFLAGGATLAAGRIVAEKGILKAVWPHSGHYRPTPENFQDFVSFLGENNVDLTDVKMDSVDEEEDDKLSKVYLRANSSEEDLAEKDGMVPEEIDGVDLAFVNTNSTGNEIPAAFEPPKSRMSLSKSRKLSNLEIPNNRDGLLEKLKNEDQTVKSSRGSLDLESPSDGYESADESIAPKPDQNILQVDLSAEVRAGIHEETISEDSVNQRIIWHKGMDSYQLGKQLSCKWSTGAGPRIGCLRDYPSELQSHALEQVNLSPRGSPHCLKLNLSPRVFTLPSLGRETPGISPLCK